MPEESFFAFGFGSGTSSPAPPGQFNIQEEPWKIREVSKNSNNNDKHGKQNSESQIQEAFWFFKDMWKGWLICQCLPVPGLCLREEKVEVMFLETVRKSFQPCLCGCRKRREGFDAGSLFYTWSWPSHVILKNCLQRVYEMSVPLFPPLFKNWIPAGNGSGPGCPAGSLQREKQWDSEHKVNQVLAPLTELYRQNCLSSTWLSKHE